MRKPRRADLICHWCDIEFPTVKDIIEHLADCDVRWAVAEAEARAQRPLTFQETITVRDKARLELKAKA